MVVKTVRPKLDDIKQLAKRINQSLRDAFPIRVLCVKNKVQVLHDSQKTPITESLTRADTHMFLQGMLDGVELPVWSRRSRITESLTVILDNNRSTYDLFMKLAREYRDQIAPNCNEVKSGIWSVEEAIVFGLADDIKDRVESTIDEVKAWSGADGISSDAGDAIAVSLVRAAFEEVDWHDIARNYLAKVNEEDAHKK